MPILAAPFHARRGALAALAGAGLLVAGCGSDDGSDGGSLSAGDRAQISAVIKRSLTSDAPGHTCRSFTPQLVRAIYRTQAACTKAETPEGDDLDIKSVTVGSISGSPDDATAALTATAKDARVSGSFGVRKLSGRWQISELRTDFLRSLLSVGLGQADLDSAGLTSAGGRACVKSSPAKLSPAVTRRTAFAAIAERKGGEDPLVQAIIRCQGQEPAGRRALTATFVDGVAKSVARDGAPASLVRCVRRRLGAEIQVPDIVAQAVAQRGGKPAPQSVARLRKAVTDVAHACAGTGGGGSTGRTT